MTKKKILFTITGLHPGGAERAATEIVTGLPTDEYEPYIVSLSGTPTDDMDVLVRRLSQTDIPVHYLNTNRATQMLQCVWRMRRMLQEIQPDLVVSFLHHANVVTAFALAGNETPHVTGIRVAEPRPIRNRLEAWATRNAKRLVCVSHRVRDFWQRDVGCRADRLVVIPNGIDCDRMDEIKPVSRGELRVASGRGLIVSVGRLHDQKGYRELIDHADHLRPLLETHDLVIVGDGELRSQLEDQIRIHRLDARVRFLGWRADAKEILASADCFLLPTKYEGMPNAVMEAMALRKPVVVFNVEGVDEVIGDGDIQAVPPNNVPLLCERALKVIHSDVLARELGERNYERMRAEFGIDRMVRRYTRLFESLTTAAALTNAS